MGSFTLVSDIVEHISLQVTLQIDSWNWGFQIAKTQRYAIFLWTFFSNTMDMPHLNKDIAYAHQNATPAACRQWSTVAFSAGVRRDRHPCSQSLWKKCSNKETKIRLDVWRQRLGSLQQQNLRRAHLQTSVSHVLRQEQTKEDYERKTCGAYCYAACKDIEPSETSRAKTLN